MWRIKRGIPIHPAKVPRRLHPAYSLISDLLGVSALGRIPPKSVAPGPIDDAIIIGMGSYLFIELCPQEIVQEHRDAINRTITGEWHEPEEITEENDVIDGEFHE